MYTYIFFFFLLLPLPRSSSRPLIWCVLEREHFLLHFSLAIYKYKRDRDWGDGLLQPVTSRILNVLRAAAFALYWEACAVRSDSCNITVYVYV
uniref:Uncharacterized protein n=1 Tax=Daphnia magna TaxID=35525 RepID=A0A0P5XZJ5_9CRUS